MNFHSKRDGDVTLASACVPIMSDSMRKTPDKYTIPPSNYMTVIDREIKKKAKQKVRCRGCEVAEAKERQLFRSFIFAILPSHLRTFAFSPSELRSPKGENASGSDGTPHLQLKTQSLFLKCNCICEQVQYDSEKFRRKRKKLSGFRSPPPKKKVSAKLLHVIKTEYFLYFMNISYRKNSDRSNRWFHFSQPLYKKNLFFKCSFTPICLLSYA